jgi:hypothetical protein
MKNQAQTDNLESTIQLLQQGNLKAIPLDQATALIDQWQKTLEGDLSEDLGELKSALQSGDGSSIAKILSDLGEDTAQAASGQNDEAGVKVRQLSQLLIKAGNSLK